MDVGMLWFDNDKQANFDIKVSRAVTYYQKKYGQKPNLCFVNPSMLPTNGGQSQLPKNKPAAKTEDVEIRGSSSMLPNHFWIGINRQKS